MSTFEEDDDQLSASPNLTSNTSNLIPSQANADEPVQKTLGDPNKNTCTNSNGSGEDVNNDSNLNTDTVSNQAPNINGPNTKPMNLKDKCRGRPYGGKMWLVKKGINILACYELSSNIMVISVELGNGKSLQIYANSSGSL
ncbi:unnamed protein product [Brachionus calyciflorus]|uniref:Uncharacterized protein n=1 Tax=Brachionus calyciflorus TaxID=104777 RepID=A0A813XUU7_9BILA|nr:unnamed protein product [Brachionus calyciflorus]